VAIDLDTLLVILRFAAGGLLVAFVTTILWMLWRDYQVAARGVLDEKRRRGRLVVIATESEGEGPDEESGFDDLIGTRFPLLPVTSLGRAPTNTIVLAEPFCSQQHALVAQRDGQWWLEDLRSSNGTMLNGAPVIEPVVLSSGDVIGIGRVHLKLELE